MQVITEANEFAPRGAVVSIGMFDGVHRGHRRVLSLLRSRGREAGLPTVLVTFDPHPRAVIRPEGPPPLLSTLDDRIALLAATGEVDTCLVLRFDKLRSAESVETFVGDTLVAHLGMRALVVGENFACGRGRKGNVDYLRTLGTQWGYHVHPVALRAPADAGSGNHCSSSETRRLIQLGEVSAAAALLERPHEITGTIAAAPSRSERAISVVLPVGMCMPAPDNYAGAVRRKEGALPWVPAILQVRAEQACGLPAVHLVTLEGIDAACGDRMALRFFHRAGELAAA
ncbi:FAD synthetase family protein [Cupriavidus sp. CV2]|uniref:FAD synthetase family protein n=1 Tax=Cupriavidus ulmosensis TaxID=3065913 RepID=UPI00296AB789|nr:FAD synthetase family protein [Cupriavidus sp. CV2]MDW3683739.1 FAD synthetase family protein [Cupriavidus sp. CV2]